MIIVQGMRLALTGVVIGPGSSFGLARMIANLLYGVTARDPLVFVVAPLVLTAVAFVGVWLPARRAVAVDLSSRSAPNSARVMSCVLFSSIQRNLNRSMSCLDAARIRPGRTDPSPRRR
jgi:hypothetical protein